MCKVNDLGLAVVQCSHLAGFKPLLPNPQGTHFSIDGRGVATQSFERANMTHTRQSMPNSGLSFKAKLLQMFQGISSSLGSSPDPATAGWTIRGMRLCLGYSAVVKVKAVVGPYCQDL